MIGERVRAAADSIDVLDGPTRTSEEVINAPLWGPGWVCRTGIAWASERPHIP